jgi:hypothetical protein
MYLGLDLAVNDSDPTSAATFGTFDWARIAPNSYAQPRLWNRVQLVGVPSPPADITPPSVAITSPSSGATVSGTVTISGTAAADVGLRRVEVLVDSGAPQTASGTSLWTLALDTRAWPNGPHTVVARAVDTVGYTSSASVSVTVANDLTAPVVGITVPAAGATLAGTVMVSASVTDNVGVVGVQFKLDGADLGGELVAAPYTVAWDTTMAANGAHTLTAEARDAAGNVSTSAEVIVTVANDLTAPTVGITVPAAGASVAGAITVSASATDNVGVVGVQFKLDGADLGGELTAAPYTVGWDTLTVGNGAHTLTAVARDAVGNTSTGSVIVTVANDLTAPTVEITAPAAGATVGGTVTVTASVTDNVGVVGVQFKLDGADLGGELTAAPYTVGWDTLTVGNGAHTLTAVARDAAGNTSTGSVIVTVANDLTAPVVGITAPAAGASVAGAITVSASATDNVGVVGVQFKLDGANLGGELVAAPYTVGWDTLTVGNGAHTLTAVARDAVGNTSTGSVIVTVANDLTAPVVEITAPAAGASVAGAITVSASATDNVGVMGVQFKLDGANLGGELTAAPYTVGWDTLTVGNGAHTLTAVVRDAAGNTTTSAGVSVTVANDLTAPTVGITAPAAGASVAGAITVSASVTDNVGVIGVQFKLDGVNLGGELTAAPYTITWDTTMAANGAHTLTAVARDAVGNTSTGSVTVTVANDLTAPTVGITAPAAGASVAGAITVSASVTDNVGVIGVQFKLDGVNLGGELTAAPYTITWDTTMAANGAHTLTAVARDAAGNTSTGSVIVTVANDLTAPTVEITAPAAGATVGGTVTVSASATDSVGVVGVQFKLNGANLGAEVTAAPYAVSWDTTTAPSGNNTLTAVARDAAGNAATSAPVSVTVLNSDLTPPAVGITAPAVAETVGGTVTVSANATDNVGVVGVQFKLNGANLGAEVTKPPYTIAWNTTALRNGTYTLTAVARDAAGNVTTSDWVMVSVFNQK